VQPPFDIMAISSSSMNQTSLVNSSNAVGSEAQKPSSPACPTTSGEPFLATHISFGLSWNIITRAKAPLILFVSLTMASFGSPQ
jgi:hypothetical protein